MSLPVPVDARCDTVAGVISTSTTTKGTARTSAGAVDDKNNGAIVTIMALSATDVVKDDTFEATGGDSWNLIDLGVEDDAFDMALEQQLLEEATCYYYDSKNIITMDIEPIMIQHADHKVAMSPSIVPLSCDDKLDDIDVLKVQEEEAQDLQEDNHPASLEHHVARPPQRNKQGSPPRL